MRYVLGLIAIVVGLSLGVRLPDVDQSTGLLLHRSIVTHGPLIPIALLIPASSSSSIPLRWFAMGVSLGFAVHLAFDLFPNGWTGYALISLPGVGWIPAALSWTWIALSTVVCTYLAARLVRGCLEAGLLVLGLGNVFIYASRGEEALWGPMAAIIIAAAFAIAMRSTAIGLLGRS